MTNIPYGFYTQPAFLQELAAANSEFKSLFAAPAPVALSIPPSSARRRARASISTSRVRRPQQQPVVQSPRNLEVDNFGTFLRPLLQLQPAESYEVAWWKRLVSKRLHCVSRLLTRLKKLRLRIAYAT